MVYKYHFIIGHFDEINNEEVNGTEMEEEIVESDDEKMQTEEEEEEEEEILPRDAEQHRDENNCSNTESSNDGIELDETTQQNELKTQTVGDVEVSLVAMNTSLDSDETGKETLQEYVTEIIDNETMVISATTPDPLLGSVQEFRIPLNALNDSVKQLIQDSQNQ